MNIDYAIHYKIVNAGSYNDYYSSAKVYYERELAVLAGIRRDVEILEIGSGMGSMVNYFFEKGFTNISCIDQSEGLLQDVNVRFGDQLKEMVCVDAVTYLKMTKRKFGVIVMFDVIEHMDHETGKNCLNLINKHLLDGGILIIRTPNMSNILGTHSRYVDLTHHIGYTEFSIKQLLEEAGYSSVNVINIKWKMLTKKWLFKRINDFIHKKLFFIHDRTAPQVFDKNLVAIGYKG